MPSLIVKVGVGVVVVVVGSGSGVLRLTGGRDILLIIREILILELALARESTLGEEVVDEVGEDGGGDEADGGEYADDGGFVGEEAADKTSVNRLFWFWFWLGEGDGDGKV